MIAYEKSGGKNREENLSLYSLKNLITVCSISPLFNEDQNSDKGWHTKSTFKWPISQQKFLILHESTI